jgi:hypothetical protein
MVLYSYTNDRYLLFYLTHKGPRRYYCDKISVARVPWPVYYHFVVPCAPVCNWMSEADTGPEPNSITSTPEAPPWLMGAQKLRPTTGLLSGLKVVNGRQAQPSLPIKSIGLLRSSNCTHPAGSVIGRHHVTISLMAASHGAWATHHTIDDENWRSFRGGL